MYSYNERIASRRGGEDRDLRGWPVGKFGDYQGAKIFLSPSEYPANMTWTVRRKHGARQFSRTTCLRER